MKIAYCTDDNLLNEIKTNPLLDGFSCVVVDEVHERSVNTDLVLGMLKQVLVRRPTLRVVLTSATLDRVVFESFFRDCCFNLDTNQPIDVPVVFVPGRTFPIEDYYEEAEEDYVTAAWRKALAIHRQFPVNTGDILVFLATIVDIDRACRLLMLELGHACPDVKVLPLHGKLMPEESSEVFKKPRPGQRKIIFSTNIAETSITIDGVVYVIDSGMANIASYDQVRNMTFLDVKLVNKSSIKQRRGRAGRTRPGICYHLYSYEQYEELEESIVPEIKKTNLSLSLLKLYNLCGESGSKISEFQFVDSPETSAVDNAVGGLAEMGLIKAVPEQNGMNASYNLTGSSCVALTTKGKNVFQRLAAWSSTEQRMALQGR